MADQATVTLLLERIESGDEQASADLLPLLYDELRKLARSRMAREGGAHTLQPTALVHEAYVRLQGPKQKGWEGRGHFFAAAAEAMRRVLIDHARNKRRQKRGGDQERVTIDDHFVDRQAGVAVAGADDSELLALDDALRGLESRDEVMAAVVKLRFFAGLSIPETAGALGISPRTVNRHWTAARAWLRREMTRS